MPDEKPLDRVPAPLQDRLRSFADRIRSLTGNRLVGLTLFGTVLEGAQPRNRHQLRTVLVLADFDLESLRRIAPAGLEFGQHGFAAPLVMTPEYIRASLDSFPLELMEIAQHRHTLYGADHFADLAFQDSHVRLQCERELKTILIAMHQGVLSAAGQDKFIDELEQHAAAALTRVLRGLLWLKEKRDQLDEVTLVDQTEAMLGCPLAGLRQALEPTAEHGWRQFRELYDDLAALRRFVDAW